MFAQHSHETAREPGRWLRPSASRIGHGCYDEFIDESGLVVLAVALGKDELPKDREPIGTGRALSSVVRTSSMWAHTADG